MASLYCWIYFLATLGWTVRALAVGWYNCQGKRWALEYAVPTNALIFGLGLLTVLAWRLMRKKGAPPVPVGELLLFSLVVSLGSVFAQLFILPMLHQACC